MKGRSKNRKGTNVDSIFHIHNKKDNNNIYVVVAVATWCKKPCAHHHTQELSRRQTIYSGHKSVCLPTTALTGWGQFFFV